MSNSAGNALRRDAHQLLRHRHADGGVRRDQHRDVARRRGDARFELRAMPGGADDDGHARRTADVERAQAQVRTREVDGHLRLREIRR